MDECEGLREQAGSECRSEFNEVSSCLARTDYTCDADDEATPDGCESELTDFAQCLEGGPGPGGASCSAICSRIEAADCDNTSNDCVDECETRRDEAAAQCGDEWDDFSSCTSRADFTCDADGDAVPEGCDAEVIALGRCLEGGPAPNPACEPAADDLQCTSCMKNSCCTEYAACDNDADCLDYVGCVVECEDVTCAQECAETYPDGSDVFGELEVCAGAECSTECRE